MAAKRVPNITVLRLAFRSQADLYIPFIRRVGNPHKRIEPENRQKNESHRLPPMFFAAQMALVMCNHIFHIRFQ